MHKSYLIAGLGAETQSVRLETPSVLTLKQNCQEKLGFNYRETNDTYLEVRDVVYSTFAKEKWTALIFSPPLIYRLPSND